MSADTAVVFVDTSFWYALRVARDARHPQARRLLAAVADRTLVTTNLVVGELWTLLVRRADHDAAVKADRAVRQRRGLRLERVQPDDEAAAWTWLYDHDEREYSFVDATSYVVMRRLGLSEALGFDGDFAAAGFVELRPG